MYYTNATYKALNEALRKGESTAITENPLLTSDQCKKIIELDDVIKNYELERSMRVYRVVDSNVMNKCLKIGVFTEHAYSSTSCYKYSSILYRQNIDFLIIDIPKGKWIGAYIADYSAYPKQYEFLIKREAKFKKKSLRKVNEYQTERWNYEERKS